LGHNIVFLYEFVIDLIVGDEFLDLCT
jgi:hypothetical protein